MTAWLAASGFAAIDWGVLAIYLGIVVAIGWYAGRRSSGENEFFLAGRSMPAWAVSLSVVATALSAATFIGGPQQAYKHDLTYLFTNVGGLIAILIVAFIFLPAYYRHNVTSVYELLGDRYDSSARRGASGMFMIGRIFASGARLFMVAIPFALIVFGDMSPGNLIGSIIIITFVAVVYTMVGGIRAVIWTDVLQAIVVIATVITALWILLSRIPVDLDTITTALEETTTAAGTPKTTFIDTSLNMTGNYTVWATIIGWTLFNLAAFGTDQDLAQRMLTCRSSKSAAWSAILSNLLSWPIVAMFLVLGLLLFIFYQRPDLMGDAAPMYAVDDSRKVFLEFILNEVPAGVRGLMIAGLFAAAMSSLDSALNALSATTVCDFLRLRRDDNSASRSRATLLLSRMLIPFWGVLLAGFACICVYWQSHSGQTLIDFALGVMMFAYSGLLAAFLTALLTKRGNSISVIAALATGFAIILIMQPFVWDRLAEHIPLMQDASTGDAISPPAMPWRMTIATSAAFIVCYLGRRARRTG